MKLFYYRLMYRVCSAIEFIHDLLGGDSNKFYPSVRWVRKIVDVHVKAVLDARD